MKIQMYNSDTSIHSDFLCEPLAAYSSCCKQRALFEDELISTSPDDIRVIELFAGVGGFRVGLERASSLFKTIWSNQWEPSTKRQDASSIYCERFGYLGHSNVDINLVDVADIPNADLLVGGFPCQDYSVATTLKNSGGIEGKKGVLWWQIHRILSTHRTPPKYLMLENVDRLLGSPASQRGRDFAIILASLSDLGYMVEWRVINAADYGMPQRRRRTYMFAYKNDSNIARSFTNGKNWLLQDGFMAGAFKVKNSDCVPSTFIIKGSLSEISTSFNKGKSLSPFKNSGVMIEREVHTVTIEPNYSGRLLLLEICYCRIPMFPTSFLSKMRMFRNGNMQKAANRRSESIKLPVTNTITLREQWLSLIASKNRHVLLLLEKEELLHPALNTLFLLKVVNIAD